MGCRFLLLGTLFAFAFFKKQVDGAGLTLTGAGTLMVANHSVDPNFAFGTYVTALFLASSVAHVLSVCCDAPFLFPRSNTNVFVGNYEDVLPFIWMWENATAAAANYVVFVSPSPLFLAVTCSGAQSS